METYWRDIDFRPAPAGWRAWFLGTAEAYRVQVAGWLVQEETESGEEYPDSERSADNRRRRVIAAGYMDGFLGALEAPTPWMVVGPSEEDPDPEEVAAALAAEEARAALRRERLRDDMAKVRRALPRPTQEAVRMGVITAATGLNGARTSRALEELSANRIAVTDGSRWRLTEDALHLVGTDDADG